MAAPRLGPIGGVFILVGGMTYLAWRRGSGGGGEGYGLVHFTSPRRPARIRWRPAAAFLPLAVVASRTIVFTLLSPDGTARARRWR